MKKSEVKANIERERKRVEEKQKAVDAYYKKLNERPQTYKNMVCPSIRYGIGGTNPNGTSGQCWHCPECGRSGMNTYNLRSIDKLIEEKCTLED